MLAFSYGLQMGWMSPMTKILKSNANPNGASLTDNEISWIASLMCIAAMCGTPVYSYLADRFGRKMTAIVVVSLQTVSQFCNLLTD